MGKEAITIRKPINISESKYFTLDQVSLTIQGNPSYKDWAKFGLLLTRIEGSVHWWIGDWVNYGEKEYGEKYSQALEETGFSYVTLGHDAWVCKAFEICRRRQNLPHSYHTDVAALNQEEADKLLDQAEKENWTRYQQADKDEQKRLEQYMRKVPGITTERFMIRLNQLKKKGRK